MSTDVQLISDGDGLAVIGEPSAVERFFASEGLQSRDLGLKRLHSVFKAGSQVAQAGSEIAAQSGRWVKLTKESAEKLSKSSLMKGSSADVNRAVLTENGKITGLLEIVKGGAGQGLTNPALLSGAAGLMAQLAMEQTMEEITEYLAAIDAKLDDVLRSQKDAVLADVIGVGFDVDEAMTLREHGGRVNEVTWSKVQGASATIARTQAYALRQLDALAEKLERTSGIATLAEAAKAAESTAEEWLAVLARCFQLQDAIAVLEIDRVMAVAPDDFDGHRVGLKAARQKRLETIAQTTERLLTRMDDAAGTANAKVLLNPIQSPAIVRSRGLVAGAVTKFNAGLGIESGEQSVVARAWTAAAGEFKDSVFETGADGVDVSMRFANETFGRAKSVTGKLSSGIAGRAARWRGNGDETTQQAE